MHKDIQADISDLNYKKHNKKSIIQQLIKKDYTENEIIDGLTQFNFKLKNKNKFIGILLTLLGIIMFFDPIPEFYANNGFYYKLFSKSDILRFNQHILKNVLTIIILITGINLIIYKTYINKFLKIILIFLFSIFFLNNTTHNLWMTYLTATIALVLIAFIELPITSKVSKIQEIVNKTWGKWNGSYSYVFIAFGIVLLNKTPIKLVFEKYGESGGKALLDNSYYFLSYTKTLLVYFGLISGILMSINKKKYKWTFFILLIISFVFLISCLFHSEFQNSTYGVSILISTIILTLLSNKLLPTPYKNNS